MELTEEQIKFLDKVCYEKRWTLNSEGKVDVDLGVDMCEMGLTEFPVKFGRVNGGFNCNFNNLTTLKNCPDFVVGSFYCTENPLTDYFKNLKEEDFPLWKNLNGYGILEKYPFLINIRKKYLDPIRLKEIIENRPHLKLYLKD